MSGTWGRRFKSCHSDQYLSEIKIFTGTARAPFRAVSRLWSNLIELEFDIAPLPTSRSVFAILLQGGASFPIDLGFELDPRAGDNQPFAPCSILDARSITAPEVARRCVVRAGGYAA